MEKGGKERTLFQTSPFPNTRAIASRVTGSLVVSDSLRDNTSRPNHCLHNHDHRVEVRGSRQGRVATFAVTVPFRILPGPAKPWHNDSSRGKHRGGLWNSFSRDPCRNNLNPIQLSKTMDRHQTTMSQQQSRTTRSKVSKYSESKQVSHYGGTTLTPKTPPTFLPRKTQCRGQWTARRTHFYPRPISRYHTTDETPLKVTVTSPSPSHLMFIAGCNPNLPRYTSNKRNDTATYALDHRLQSVNPRPTVKCCAALRPVPNCLNSNTSLKGFTAVVVVAAAVGIGNGWRGSLHQDTTYIYAVFANAKPVGVGLFQDHYYLPI